MPVKIPTDKISDSVFSELEVYDPPGFLFVDHIAIAVCAGDLESQVRMYQQIGFRELHREEIGGRDQVREVLLQIGESPNLIQLVEPMSADSPVQKQLDRNGGRGGLAHVGLRVKNAQVAFDFFKAKNFRIIDEAPRPGSRGTTVFFLHPKSHEDSAFGVLYEVVEDPTAK
ncbi:MAG: VOC family protein [SAR324 cluster bacterium]|jgi:methylmalonyl-CoA/ethylmalonyl-CoA epimerase|tara:strand:- start:327 stop:839 length:513 start_codon:yes stop_codon:yes gene_type:complete